MILSELLESAAGSHAAVIIPESGVRVSYDALRRQVDTVAEALAGAGIRRGDRVALALPNGLPALVCLLATSVAGTAAPLNPAHREEEVRFSLDDTGARVLVVPTEGADEARRAAGDRVRIVAADINADGTVQLLGCPAPDRANPPNSDDIALVLHTSGSTDRPKRVPLKHTHLTVSARNIASAYALGPSDVSLAVMPLFHVHGLVASALATWASGGTVVIPSRFSPLSFWRLVRDYGVTWYSAAPTLHQLVLSRTEGHSGRPSTAERLRFVRSCSAPLAPEAMKRLEAAFGTPVLEAYGMTEAAHQMTSNPLPPAARKPGSVGQGTGVRVGIVGPNGSFLSWGTHGEVVVQGPNVIDGYEDDADANAAAFLGSWFRTGDQGFLDADGYLHLVGRIKELINRGGEKISPREVEGVLLAHPAVAEAVAFGVPHAMWGEVAAVAVVLRDEAQLSEADLLKHCRDHLAEFKCPTKIYVAPVFPHTATGKIQRWRVAAAYRGAPK